jgi:hypothetical protein
MMFDSEVIETVAWSAPVIVPHRIPIRSMMLPTLATKPTVTIPAGHWIVSRCDGDAVPGFDQPKTVGLVDRDPPSGSVPHINCQPEA